MVVHLAAPVSTPVSAEGATEPALVGFVVNKAVGNAVTRNQVKRRLRHLARERVASLPRSAVLVVRALPAAAGASYDELDTDLDDALIRALSRVAGRLTPPEGGAR